MWWRANGIADFMVRISQAVKAIKPHLKISLFPNFQYYAYKYYLQDYENWVNKGLVDEFILQVYRDDKNSFVAEIEKLAVQYAMTKIPVSIRISTVTTISPVDIKRIQEQVQIVRDGIHSSKGDHNFAGFSFFYWES
jgi:uncharacterized lipoprotein YddW (UPF0748 family)